MKALKELLGQLEAKLPELEDRRFSSAFANDVFEAVDYWRNLGQHVLDGNTKVNYPDRAQSQLELLSRLEAILRTRSADDQKRYAQLLGASKQLLARVGQVRPPEDGHLGVLRVIGECFQFLRTEYNFAITNQHPTGVRFSSAAVYLNLECIENPVLSCSFGPKTEPQQIFWIGDLLFMNGNPGYRTLPEELVLDTESQVKEWFAFLARVFTQYGRSVLTNQPDIFRQLAEAQAERDAEYAREMDRRFGQKE